jgi:hypothetical protein
MANKIKLLFFALVIIFNYASGDLSNSSLPSNEGLNFNMEHSVPLALIGQILKAGLH